MVPPFDFSSFANRSANASRLPAISGSYDQMEDNGTRTERPVAGALSLDEHDDILLAHRRSSCKDPDDRISPAQIQVSMNGDCPRIIIDLSGMTEVALPKNQLHCSMNFEFHCSVMQWDHTDDILLTL